MSVTGAPQLMRIQDIVDALGITRATVYKYVNDGRLPPPFYLAPRKPRWRIAAVEAAIQRLESRESANA